MPSSVSRLRLLAQRLTAGRLAHPADVVRWLGAVQGQDYPGALWAIGLRTRGTTEAAVEQAIADRTLVRTWPMRRTLHLVAAEDVRWMLALLAPRAVAGLAGRLRQLGLDEAALGKSRDAIARALEGGRRLRRDALYEVLGAAGVPPGEMRGLHVLARLSMEGLICHAGRDGKQQTFVLLDAWVPAARPLPREAALAELGRRYFTGHGPATVDDLAWWAGLPRREAREALELARAGLERVVRGGREYWRGDAPASPARSRPGQAHLLPAFDELLVGYRDRSATLAPAHAARVHALLSPTVVVGDRVVGTWTRRLVDGEVVVRVEPFGRGLGGARAAVERAAERYAAFLGRRLRLG